MLDYSVTVGLAPCRRWRDAPKTLYCNPEVARAIKKEVVAHIKKRYESRDVRFVDIDFLNDEGMMCESAQAPAVAEHFKREKVDAVFIINTNFGSEEAAGLVAKLVGKPTLLWGPRDKLEADGHRDTDTQCGLFAVSKQLLRYHVKFSYIENCRIEDPVFDEGLQKFIRVVRMLKNFADLRVGQIGSRTKAFYSVVYNEAELIDRFGIEVVPVSSADAVLMLNDVIARTADKQAAVAELKEKYDTGGHDDDTLWRTAAYLEFYRRIAEMNDCRVLTSECFPVMHKAFGAMPCPAMSLLACEGLLVACEADVHGAVTMALLAAAAGRDGRPPIFGEFTMRHPEDDNTELLWHCGALPHCLAREGCRPRILPNTRNELMLEGKGDFTVCRFDALGGKYHLLAGRCRGVEGPYTYGAGIWLKFDNLPKWERTLIEGPYIHHVTEIPGDFVEEIKEFGRYYPDIQLDMP